MSPSMQLAQGIYRVVSTYAKSMNITTQLLVAREKEKGGEEDKVDTKAHILVGTTGRITNVFNLRDRAKPWYINPNTISLLILDEADKMLNSLELGGQTLSIRKQCKGVKQVCVLFLSFFFFFSFSIFSLFIPLSVNSVFYIPHT